MPYDAGMLAAVRSELDRLLTGGKVMKIQQPEKDEILLQIHSGRENYKLSLSASSNNPRVNLTELPKDNPMQAPMFCMLLRKHLTGAILREVSVLGGFERVLELAFDTHDEMGFDERRYLITEITGKFSNILFCDGSHKIVSALRTTDLLVSNGRPVLPGVTYALLPRQEGKRDPLTETREGFAEVYTDELPPDKLLTRYYAGFSPLVAREIAYRAGSGGEDALWNAMQSVVDRVCDEDFTPVLLRREDGSPLEFCYFPVEQYGSAATSETFPDFGSLIDAYYGERDKRDRMRQRSADIQKLLTNAEGRLTRKIALQREDIAAGAKKEEWRLHGELITANIWQMKRGMTAVTLTDYTADPPRDVTIPLEPRMTPAQNAQAFYKKYTKAKAAERELKVQIEKAESELAYLETVQDALSRAGSESELADIRAELSCSGYAPRMKALGVTADPKALRKQQSKPMVFHTSAGHELLVGRNNRQNDEISHRVAERDDWWFHVKNAPGSHVILRCTGDEVSDGEMTEAAAAAAYFSSQSDGESVAVDYVQARHLRKPAGAAPGFVIYHTNRTAYVKPAKPEN